MALFSAVHPVTANQLVTRDPSEARELGYGREQILGYALAVAPVTGTLERPPFGIPLGVSRFGSADAVGSPCSHGSRQMTNDARRTAPGGTPNQEAIEAALEIMRGDVARQMSQIGRAAAAEDLSELPRFSTRAFQPSPA